jgi:hypothetical protein
MTINLGGTRPARVRRWLDDGPKRCGMTINPGRSAARGRPGCVPGMTTSPGGAA